MPVPARIGLALALSAALHAWLGAGMAVKHPAGAVSATASLTVALEQPAAQSPRPLPEPSSVISFDKNEPPAPSRTPVQRRAEPKHHPAQAAHHPAQAAAPPAGESGESGFALPPSDVYYTAEDLDVYPALQAPLRLAPLGGGSAAALGGRLLAMLTLDEAGHLQAVSVVGETPGGRLEEAVRAIFSSARFTPARKNGRAVKSRILVSVEFGTVKQ